MIGLFYFKIMYYVSVIQSVGTKSLRNPVSYDERYEPQKDEHRCQRDGRQESSKTTQHRTEQNRMEENGSGLSLAPRSFPT